MNKIQFVTGLHGDEKLPIIALASINEEQVVANTLALAKNVRFIEKDLNASFGTSGMSYEERLAKKLVRRLDKNKLVIDLHTNQSMNEAFVIVVDKKMIPFASTLGIPKIVFMKYNIKKGYSLIDYFAGVSVEVGKHFSFKSIKNTIRIVSNLNKPSVKRVTLYEVFGKIDKQGKYKNFIKCREGFIPLFAGKNSYNCYGLKARIIKQL